MERKRMNQIELARRLGVSRSAVNAWINDRAWPQGSIGALEEILDVSLVPEPDGPPVSPELRAMIEALSPEERAWVMEQLAAADQRLRRREDPGGGDAQPPRQEAAG